MFLFNSLPIILIIVLLFTRIQSYPSGTPNLIKPSLDRLDYKKLSAHAKQYRLKCGISEEAQRWWIKYLQDLQTIVSKYPNQTPPQWPIQHLVGMAQHKDKDPRASSTGDSIDISELPDHVMALHQKEVGQHPQVIKGEIILIISYTI